MFNSLFYGLIVWQVWFAACLKIWYFCVPKVCGALFDDGILSETNIGHNWS